MLIPTYVMTGAALYFGIDATRSVDAAAAAAKYLLGSGS